MSFVWKKIYITTYLEYLLFKQLKFYIFTLFNVQIVFNCYKTVFIKIKIY